MPVNASILDISILEYRLIGPKCLLAKGQHFVMVVFVCVGFLFHRQNRTRLENYLKDTISNGRFKVFILPRL